jgi:hypothetical protein
MGGRQYDTGKHLFPQGVGVVTHTGRTVSDQQPLVADVGRAAALLKVPERELLAAIRQAQVEVWGVHSQGMAVYRWEELVEAAAAAGLSVPTHRGHAWRRRPAVIRRVVTPYGVER